MISIMTKKNTSHLQLQFGRSSRILKKDSPDNYLMRVQHVRPRDEKKENQDRMLEAG